mmetsp:Transcript_5906/g.13647  ORF Transcript_5906/g.13647 Transcript_5906/m.13647 type:complete len:222 (+) Transcript_5906:489-1154(+)
MVLSFGLYSIYLRCSLYHNYRADFGCRVCLFVRSPRQHQRDLCLGLLVHAEKYAGEWHAGEFFPLRKGSLEVLLLLHVHMETPRRHRLLGRCVVLHDPGRRILSSRLGLRLLRTDVLFILDLFHGRDWLFGRVLSFRADLVPGEYADHLRLRPNAQTPLLYQRRCWGHPGPARRWKPSLSPFSMVLLSPFEVDIQVGFRNNLSEHRSFVKLINQVVFEFVR